MFEPKFVQNPYHASIVDRSSEKGVKEAPFVILKSGLFYEQKCALFSQKVRAAIFKFQGWYPYFVAS